MSLFSTLSGNRYCGCRDYLKYGDLFSEKCDLIGSWCIKLVILVGHLFYVCPKKEKSVPKNKMTRCGHAHFNFVHYFVDKKQLKYHS